MTIAELVEKLHDLADEVESDLDLPDDEEDDEEGAYWDHLKEIEKKYDRLMKGLGFHPDDEFSDTEIDEMRIKLGNLPYFPVFIRSKAS